MAGSESKNRGKIGEERGKRELRNRGNRGEGQVMIGFWGQATDQSATGEGDRTSNIGIHEWQLR